MIRKTYPRNARCLLAIAVFALLLALAWPLVLAAQGGPLGPPGSNPPIRPTSGGPNTDPGGNIDPTPTRTPTPPGGGPPAFTPPTSTPRPGAPPSGDTPTLQEALAEYERIKALAPNRIIFHAATPIQLCKVEDGLQVYYIGRDGKTRLGPWVPGFAELAAKYPDPAGPEASIYLGFNPLTGKRVKIDYLPSVKRIRVDTFYPDRENDRNKQYIFHFGPEHDITYDVW